MLTLKQYRTVPSILIRMIGAHMTSPLTDKA
jgi:hypothetical protein